MKNNSSWGIMPRMEWTREKLLKLIDNECARRDWSMRRIVTEVEKKYPTARKRLSYHNLMNFIHGKTDMLKTHNLEQILSVLTSDEEPEVNALDSGKATISDAEIALTDAYKVMMQIILYHKLASQESFIHAFSAQYRDYQEKGLQNAAVVMNELLAFAAGEPRQPEQEVIRKLLQLRPQGSA